MWKYKVTEKGNTLVKQKYLKIVSVTVSIMHVGVLSSLMLPLLLYVFCNFALLFQIHCNFFMYGFNMCFYQGVIARDSSQWLLGDHNCSKTQCLPH